MLIINLAVVLQWVIAILIGGAGILGLIAWLSTGKLNVALLGIATLLLSVYFILPIFGVNVDILYYITLIGAPLLYIVGFILTMKEK
ncbi:MAG TPA: hypothetical protein VM054_02120 [bacterium]|nr:hypothetical protein [bacterium]